MKKLKHSRCLFESLRELSVLNNWKVWDDLVDWATKTGSIESRLRGISYQIIEKLKLGRKINPWLQNQMENIWKTAISKGFKPKSRRI